MCKNLIKIIIIGLLILLPSYLNAKTIILDSTKQFHLAEKHFEEKAYDLAVSEYKKFIFLFPNDKNVETAHYKVALAYFEGGVYNRSIEEIEKTLSKFSFGTLFLENNILMAKCFNKLGNFSQVNHIMKNLLVSTEVQNEKDKILYEFAWFCFENGKWERGKHYLSKISDKNREKYDVQTLNKKLELLSKLNKKNPTIAGALSVIPGLGFAYCERYQDAFTSFLFNGLLIIAAKESFDDDKVALGAFITIIETGFYSGNIYGSISSAHKYNKKQENIFYKFIKESKISLSSNLKNSSFVSLNFKF